MGLSRAFSSPATSIVPALFAIGMLTGCNDGHSQSARTETERPVLVAEVHYLPQVEPRSLTATIRPRIESDLGFRVPGKVAHRLVETGQRVRKGDVLATLDDTDAHLQREQAAAELAAARTSLDQTTADAKRGEELQRNGWTAQAAVEKLRAAAEEARGRLRRAEKALELSQNALSYATLTADADGVVTATSIEPGQVVAAGQPAIRIAQLTEKEAVVAVPETMTAAIEKARASVSLWARPDRSLKASLRELAPAADPVTRTYTARFSLPDADDGVALGMSATLTLSDPADRKAARLPLSALFNQGAGPSLWTVDTQGGLALKPVTVVGYESDAVLIANGVEEGEKVVVLGVQKLDQHQRVRTVSRL